VAQLRKGKEELESRLGFPLAEPKGPVPLARAALPEPRIPIPRPLSRFATQDRYQRAFHAHGCSFAEVVAGFEGRFPRAPDLVLFPATEHQVEVALEWCSANGVAVVPFGGGTSVVGGVLPAVGDRYNAAVSLDLNRLRGISELDTVSLSARVKAGTAGPQLEEELRPHGLAFRHYPQSFQFSTVGGWVATRAAGHYGTGPTHIEDRVEGVVALTPAGAWRSRRLPASGAGPSPDRLLAGSEGVLGVITEVWLKVVRRPELRARLALSFPGFFEGCDYLREALQADLVPTTCRLLDEQERALSFPGKGAVLLLSFERRGEGAERQARAELSRAAALAKGFGGRVLSREVGEGRPEAEAAYREAFFAGPYLRDLLIHYGAIAETFETAITWERLPALHEAVYAAAREAFGEEGFRLSCRLTHAYPDGAAPYFTVVGPSRHGEQVDRWLAVKEGVSRAILGAGGTITHHHAVGRDHLPYYLSQRPEPFAAALAAAKRALDPGWIMNPGVLLAADLKG
jgi:alkyldihydroxyacetonephosphate synthase